ncbi:FtsW/RodA/SpoVE family cell cycle protein [Rossellomorea sp. GAMAL-10_SWC]
MKEDRTSPFQIDFKLLFILFCIAAVSYLAITSAMPSLPANLRNINFAGQQIKWYIIGLVGIAFIMIIDFDRYKNVIWYMYGFGLLLLLGLELHIPGAKTIKGATAWYTLPGIGNFQPSELMKIFMIIILGTIISRHNEMYSVRGKREDILLLGKIFGIALPPLLLIAKEPDLGNTMVMCAIIATMILISGIRWRYILGLVILTIGLGAFMVYLYFYHFEFFTSHVLEEYQLNRFYGWLAPYEYPSQGYQLTQALMAAGSGLLTGKGFHNGEAYFPEPHTDFIFTVICEQYGFIGASVVISLFFLLIYRMIHIALESNDKFGSYICAGVVGMFTFQIFQNIGMTIGLLPITGITLPFVSYGGSSLATNLLAIGFILNVRSRTNKYMFD